MLAGTVAVVVVVVVVEDEEIVAVVVKQDEVAGMYEKIELKVLARFRRVADAAGCDMLALMHCSMMVQLT